MSQSDHKDEPGKRSPTHLSELFTEKIFTKRRTYYIDARENSKVGGSKHRYITLTESRKTDQGLQRNRIFVAEEDIDNFLTTFKAVADRMRD